MGKGGWSVIGIVVVCCCIGVTNGDEYVIYKDPKQALNRRIKNLLRQMSLEEKIGQMVQIERTVASPQLMKNYFIGSILSGGGSVPAPQASPKIWVGRYGE